MSADPSTVPNHRRAQATPSLAVLADGPQHGDIGAWESEQSLQTDTDTSTGPSWDPFRDYFDAESQYWPSSASVRSGLDSHVPLLSQNSDHLIQSTVAHATHQTRPTSSFPQERHTSSAVFPPEQDVLSSPHRADIALRNSLREMILSAILSEVFTPPERVALLDDCRTSAESSNLGIPFREILSEPMEPLGVSPLMYEIMGCEPDWDIIDAGIPDLGLEMAVYLIKYWNENVLTYGRMGALMNVIRAACLRRLDEYEGNKLFHYLRGRVFEIQSEEGDNYFDYDVSVAHLYGAHGHKTGAPPSNLDFTALISVPHFAFRLVQPASAVSMEDELHPSTCRKDPITAGPTYVPVEFLAAKRAWRLKIGSNSLKLELLDGPGGSVSCNVDEESALTTDARVKIILPERDQPGPGSDAISSSKDSRIAFELRSEAPVELLLPRKLLVPATALGSGASETTLSPCFCPALGEHDALRGLDDSRILHDGRGALLLELTMRFAHDSLGFAIVNVNNATSGHIDSASVETPSGRVDVHQSNLEDEDGLYVFSEIEERMGELNLAARHEESEWEEVSQIDETEATDGGWVKASWSGKDEEL